MGEKINIKTPSTLHKDISYKNWKKEIKIWQKFTSVEKEKQALAIFLSMQGKARELLLELKIDELNQANGVDKVLEKLDTLY